MRAGPRFNWMLACGAAGMVAVHFLFLTTGGAAEPAPSAVSETVPTLAERDQLYERAEKLAAEGKLVEAIEVARQMLAMEERIFGANSEDVAGSYDMISGFLERLDRFPEAIEALSTQLEILTALHGADDWRVVDARRAIVFSRQRSQLTAGERRQLDAANAKESLFIQLRDQGKFADAIVLARECLAIRRQVLGEEHPDVAESSNHVGFFLTSMGDHAAARPYYEQALAIRQKVLGEEHPNVGESLNNLAFLLSNAGDHAAARPYFEQALAIHKKTQGEEHRDTVTLLDNLGDLHRSMRDYAAAGRYYEQALAIRKKVLGEEHPDVAQSLNNLGFLLMDMSDYAAARPYFELCLAICEGAFGPEDIHTANSLNNLGFLLHAMGDSAAARPYHERALAIKKKILGEEHPDTALSLNNVGFLLQEMSDYAAARPFLEQALATRRKVFGEEHAATAESLNNMGTLLQAMGDYAAAQPYHERALAIRKKVLGAEHPDTAVSLNNLAIVLEFAGDSAAARPYYEQALAIQKKVLGDVHPDTAASMNNLGLLLYDMGDSAAARPYFEQALAIRKKVLGEEHPDTAISLTSLGILHKSLGDYPAAKRYGKQALAIHRKVQGAEHLYTAKALSNLAIISAVEEDWPAAIEAFAEANLIQQRSLEKVFATATEARMRAYLATMSDDLDLFLSLPLIQLDREADGLTWVLRRKAIVFEALCLSRTAQWLAREDSEFAARHHTLVAARKQLDDVTLRPPTTVAPDELLARRTALQTQIAELEDQLQSALSDHLGKDWSLMATIDSVRSQLPTDAAVIELAKYRPRNFQAKVRKAERYVAFVLHADAKRPVELVELGEAAPIDASVAALSEHQKDVQRAGELADWPALETQYRGLAAPLYDKLFAPIAAKLAGVKRVYLSPDSQLHNLPFEALVDADGKYLAEQGYTFAYLASGRDLLRGQDQQLGEGAFVFAAPNYDLQHGERFQLARQPAAAPPLAAARQPAAAPAVLLAAAGPLGTRSADVRGLRWKVLPSMAPEGAEAAEHLANGPYGNVQSYNGDAALEEHFKRLVHPRLVVLVTHGFYLPDQPANRAELFGDDPTTRSAFAQGAGLARLRAQENPLYRSGVILAGANTLDDPVPDGVSVEDGWLTAEEISQLDLRGTDLVVLSACNTGRGQVATGDAVAGLRSAFLFAGTKTLVGSLYEVPDEQTRQLMQTFYAGLRARRGKLQSLNAARLKLIERLRAEYGAAHPFFWASFVLVGQP